MYLSLNWLGDHVDLSGLDPEAIAHELTMRTALIEGFVDQRAALAGVVVGEVLECGQHPGADRLSVCKVDAGDGGEPQHVVCGAPNVAAGQKIIYAPVGTRLPNGLKLKKAKIRGEVSAGMICAEDELGLGPEHDGILVLDPDLSAGTPIGEVPGLTDVLFDIDNKSITHRPDLWGHRGFARELAAIFDRELKPLPLHDDLVVGEEGPAIELEDDCGCPVYAGLSVDGTPGPSPDWLRFRLVACGMRPINRLVDLSNYVMLELGQPTHPFDRDKLSGDRIVVRRGQEGETLTTLDEVQRALAPTDTVIADGAQGVAIAGIMGSADAEVGEGTTRVFLESASFDPQGVRRTSSRLGLRTEALARFEKSLDPGLVHEAVRRYAQLLRELDPEATIHTTYRVAGEAAAPTRTLTLHSDRVSRLLGLTLEPAQVSGALESIGFGVRDTGDGAFDVTVPTWRATRDITLEEDLVEEVGRIVGYDRVGSPNPVGPLLIGERDPIPAIEELLRDALSTRGSCTEVFSYSTIRDRTVEQLGLELAGDHPRLTNALQQAASRLRPSVVPELLMRLEDWLRHGEEARMFEVGRGYHAAESGTIVESREVAVVVARRGGGDDRDLVRQVRGVADAALTVAGRSRPRLLVTEAPASSPWLHPHRTAALELDGGSGPVRVGTLGAVAPATLAALELDASAAVLVFDSAALAQLAEAPSDYRPVSRQPPAHIDLAFVVDYATSTDELVAAIQKAGPKTLVRVEPFDVYRGGSLADDERSIALHLTFQAKDRTLTDEQVHSARERIVKGAEQLGARLR